MSLTVTVPYEDYSKLVEDSAEKANVIKLLKTEFPDDTCQLIAIKAMLGVVDETSNEEPSDTPSTEPSEGEDTNGENLEGGDTTTTE